MFTQPQLCFRPYLKALAGASAVVLFAGACSAVGAVGPGDSERVTFEASGLPDPDAVVLPEADDTGDDAPEPEIEPDLSTGDYDETAAYCEPTELGYDALGQFLDANDRKSHETGRDNQPGDVSVMNEAGAEMLEGIDGIELHWAEAQSALDGADFPATTSSLPGDHVIEAYDDYFEYLTDFARPEAYIAAQAGSMDEYAAATADIAGLGGAIEIMVQSAHALNTILDFNLENCGIDRQPGM